MESIVLGGGCFWCLDAGYRLINGVVAVTSGYAGGHTKEPSYYAVAGGNTGHAEVVKIDFDPKIISLEEVLNIFWAMHDPTTLNYQGNDMGTEYRSIILFNNEDHKRQIEKSIIEVGKLWDKPVITEVIPLDKFYAAEEEHQNYFARHPYQAYCQVIINPKLAKLRKEFSQRLKD